MKRVLLLMALTSTLAVGQNNKRDSIWSPINYFLGTWKGEGGGEPGTGKYERSYQPVLNKNFIEVQEQVDLSANRPAPKGEVHEDIGYLIYDKGRKTFLLRQLHIEGFVNDYVMESISADKKNIVFVSEAIVNIPNGWKARETYRIINDKEFEETFELAEPGKEFAVYTKVKFVRQ